MAGRRRNTPGRLVSVIVGGALAGLSVQPAVGQGPFTPSLQVLEVDTSELPLVRATVVIPPGYAQPSFEVEEDGQSSQVEARPAAPGEVRVALVVDNPPTLPSDERRGLQAAALDFLLSVPPEVRTVVAGTAGPPAALAEDAGSISSAVTAIGTSTAAVGDRAGVVADAVSLLGDDSPVPPALVLLASAGSGPSDPAVDLDQLAEGRPRRTTVAVLGARRPAWLRGWSPDTGRPLVVGNLQQLQSRLGALASELSSTYVVTLPVAGSDARLVTLRVRDGVDGTARRAAVVLEPDQDPDAGLTGATTVVLAAGAGLLLAGAVAIAAARRKPAS